MAEKRMFSNKVIGSDEFLEMPDSTQNLYFHLSMNADDDGFVDKVKSIMRMTGKKEDDLRILIAKKFIIPFESGVIVIRHWRVNNYLRSDRYKETQHLEEKSLLSTRENGEYSIGIPMVDQMDTQYRLDKNRLEENSKKESEKEKNHKYGKYGWFLLTDTQIEKLYNEFGKDYINQVIDILDEQVQSTGNKNKYKDWNLVIRKAIRDKWSCLKGIKTNLQPQHNDDYVNVDISYIGKYGETVFDVYPRKKGQTEWTEEDKERILKEKGGKRWIY